MQIKFDEVLTVDWTRCEVERDACLIVHLTHCTLREMKLITMRGTMIIIVIVCQMFLRLAVKSWMHF